MKIKFSMVIFVVLFSQNNFASSSFGNKAIETIMIHDSGTIRIFLEGTPAHTESCDNKTPLILDENNKFFKEMYSGLLAALKTKSKITGYVSGCITSWDKTFPRIVRLDFNE